MWVAMIAIDQTSERDARYVRAFERVPGGTHAMRAVRAFSDPDFMSRQSAQPEPRSREALCRAHRYIHSLAATLLRLITASEA